MKIAGANFREDKIRKYTPERFQATYKRHYLDINADHGHGKARDKDQTRFDLTVTDMNTGMYAVDDYNDFDCIEDAIAYCLKGALLVREVTP